MFEDENAIEAHNPLHEAALAARKQYRDGISLASGLLLRDWQGLLLVYIALITPALLSSLLPTLTTGTVLILSAVERFLYANFFYFLLRRWFREFSTPQHTPSFRSYLVIVGIHAVLWSMMTLPAFSQNFNLPEMLDGIGIILLIPLTILSIRYFFYFMPVMLGYTNARQILSQAEQFTIYHRSLPIKLIIPPLVVSTLYSGLVTGFSPDLRHASAALMLDAGDGLFWVLSCYLSLGVGFSILAKNRPLTSDLDPYLDARLETLRLHAPAWLTGLLHPAHAGKLILVSILIWTGNMIRMWEIAPSPTIVLESVSYDGKGEVSMKLKLTDESYMFRGFRPILFRLAGESGEPLTMSPTEARTSDGIDDIAYYYPRTSPRSELTLSFSLVNRSDDFANLSDVHLWYTQTKVAHIEQSKIIRK